AFFVRIPVSWLASRIRPVSLFKIGLATPASTALQIVLCVVYYFRRKRQADRGRENFDIAGD
ncbi:MAG: MATE family efflux transporter, partial [Firmicutes bacterium]|nr:MATE family efflux transporter [Bacillota bacterium]